MESVLVSLVFVALVLADIGIVAARRSRNRFIWDSDSFLCRFRARRTVSTVWPGLARYCARRWSRPMWARWVDDVLMVRRGPLLPRILSLRAQVCDAGVYDMPPDEPNGLGRRPVAAELRLNDGLVLEVATAWDEGLVLVGPYLAAAAAYGAQGDSSRDGELDVQARQPHDHEEGWQ